MRDYWHKFYMAVETILTNSASLQERLSFAYLNYLIDIDENDLPLNIRQNFVDLMAGFIMIEPSLDKQRIEINVKKMLVWQASRLADKIIHIFGMIAEEEAKRIELKN